MKFLNQKNINSVQKIIKYVLIGLIIIVSARYIPDKRLHNKEIIMIGSTSAISYAILDMISPTIRISQCVKDDKLKNNKVVVEA